MNFFYVLIGRVGGSFLALLFTLLAPLSIGLSELGEFFQQFTQLMFLAIFTRIGADILFFEKSQLGKVYLLPMLVLSFTSALVISVVFNLFFDARYLFLLPFISFYWVVAAYLKTINKQIKAQALEFYVLYSFLILYLVLVLCGCESKGRLDEYFVYSVAIGFFISLFLVRTELASFQYGSGFLMTIVRKRLLGLKTLHNVLIMLGNFFIVWGPILLFQMIAATSTEIGEFSVAYKYASAIILVSYVVHAVWSRSIKDGGENSYVFISEKTKLLNMVGLLLIVLDALFFLVFPQMLDVSVIFYTGILLPFLILYVMQSLKLLKIAYSNYKYKLVYVNLFAFFVLLVISGTFYLFDINSVFNFIISVSIVFVLMYFLIGSIYQSLKVRYV